MILALIIVATIVSTILYAKLSFSNELSFLSSSYQKTLSFTNHQESDTSQIKESLAQMKVLLTIFSKLLLVLLPFLTIALYLIWKNIPIHSVFFNLQNNLIVVATFFMTKYFQANEK